jgi:DnaJ-class molecular chaperone
MSSEKIGSDYFDKYDHSKYLIKTCPKCGGDGLMERNVFLDYGIGCSHHSIVDCSYCNGTGKV